MVRYAHRYCLCAATASLAFPPATAGAQDNTIIVTGSRIDPAGPGVTVLEQQDIERAQPVNLLEPIDRIAGVRAFSKGGLSYLSVRGGEPNFTLVLIDGIRVNDPTNSRGGAFDFEQIDPAAIERIEVARIALSPVHGADALSGAVHLRLRSPKAGESSTSGRAFIDSRGAGGVSATARHGWGNGGILFAGGLFDSGDLHEGVDIGRAQIFTKARQEVGSFTLAALALHAAAERTAFPEDSGGPRFAVIREREERNTALTLAAVELVRNGEPAVRPRLAVHWSRQKTGTDTPAIAPGALDGVPPIVADARFDRLEATADVRVRLGERISAAAGASLIREVADSHGFIDIGFRIPSDFAIERTARGLFSEVAVDLRPARVTAAVRYDDPSGEPGVVTVRLGGSLAAGSRTTLFADYAEGYKSPSLFALAFPIGANPNLRPERSRTISAGIEQLLANGRVKVALFDSRFRNLVDFDAEQFIHVNRGRVSSRGVELEAAMPLGSSITLAGALTYMDVKNQPGAPPLRSRPKWEGAIALDWRATEQLKVSLTGRFNSRYFDSSVPTGLIAQKGHSEIDATATFRASQRVTFLVTGRNLTAQTHFDAVGFPAPSRTIRVGVQGHF